MGSDRSPDSHVPNDPLDAPDPKRLRASATPPPARERAPLASSSSRVGQKPPSAGPASGSRRSLLAKKPSFPPLAAPPTGLASAAPAPEPAPAPEVAPAPAAPPSSDETRPPDAVTTVVAAAPVDASHERAPTSTTGGEAEEPAAPPIPAELTTDEWELRVARRSPLPLVLALVAVIALCVGGGAVLLAGLGASVDAAGPTAVHEAHLGTVLRPPPPAPEPPPTLPVALTPPPPAPPVEPEPAAPAPPPPAVVRPRQTYVRPKPGPMPLPRPAEPAANPWAEVVPSSAPTPSPAPSASPAEDENPWGG